MNHIKVYFLQCTRLPTSKSHNNIHYFASELRGTRPSTSVAAILVSAQTKKFPVFQAQNNAGYGNISALICVYIVDNILLRVWQHPLLIINVKYIEKSSVSD